MAGGAVAFHPEVRLDEIWHEGNVRDIESWFLDQKEIGLVHVDQASRGSVV